MLLYLNNAESDEGRAERELRPRAPGAAHGRRRRRATPRTTCAQRPDPDRLSDRLDHGRVPLPSPATTGPGPSRSSDFGHPTTTPDGDGRGRRLPGLPRPPPGHRPAPRARSSRAGSSATTRPPRLVTGSPRPTSRTTRRSCRCCAQLFTSPEFAASSARRCGGRSRTWWRRCASSAPARRRRPADGSRASDWALDGQGTSRCAWPRPERLPRPRRRLASSAGTLARWNTTPRLAAGWWPTGLQLPDAAAPCCRRRCPPRTARSSRRSASGWCCGQLPAAHRDGVCAFLGRSARATPLRADSAAVGWRLPYMVALILDSPYH